MKREINMKGEIYMLSFEKKFLNWVEKNYQIVFFIIISILGGCARYAGKDFISGDLNGCLIPWYNTFKGNGGFQRLSKQVGDYNLLYQTMIAALSYIDINCVYLYKIVSSFFDYLLALSCAYIGCKFLQKDWKKDGCFNLIYTVILFLPTVAYNSSYWGQCDSMYVVFIMWTVYLIYAEKYKTAFIMLGIGFAFKLQSIFIIPAILMIYVSKKKFSLLNFFFTIVSFWCSGIVGYFNGRGLFDCFTIYLNQTKTYERMYMNISSFWILSGNDSYETLNKFAVILTIILLGIGLYIVLEKRKTMDTPSTYLNTFCWCVWTVLLFLPAMHERYTYMLDIMLVLLCFVNCRYIFCTFVEVLLSLLTYNKYLFGTTAVNNTFAIANLVAWIIFSVMLMQEENNHISKEATDAIAK